MPKIKHNKKIKLPDVTLTFFRDDRTSTKSRWHYREANGRRYQWLSSNGRNQSYLDTCVLSGVLSTISTSGSFRDSNDTYKNRKRIKQRHESYELETNLEDYDND